MTKSNLSIIIPTYNKLPRLKLMLTSLSVVSGIEDTEVIIVNDGSSDGTAEFLDEYIKSSEMELKVINVTNGGRSYARNIGVKHSVNERIVFCDDDLILDKDFIKEHLKYLDMSEKNVIHGYIYSLSFLKFFFDPENGVFFKEYKSEKKMSGLLKFCITSDDIRNNFCKIEKQRRTTKFEKDIQQLFEAESQAIDSKYTWLSSNGGNLSMYRDLFLKAGAFDENMGKRWGAEDLELGYRLHKTGGHFCFADKAINYHMTHVRENAKAIHDEAFGFFQNKYNDDILRKLQLYFDGRVSSLIEWREICENEN